MTHTSVAMVLMSGLLVCFPADAQVPDAGEPSFCILSDADDAQAAALRLRENGCLPFGAQQWLNPRIIDLNDDGLLDIVFDDPWVLPNVGQDIAGDALPQFAAIAQADGPFSLNHPAATEFLRVQCPVPPALEAFDGVTADEFHAIACALWWGAPEAHIAQLSGDRFLAFGPSRSDGFGHYLMTSFPHPDFVVPPVDQRPILGVDPAYADHEVDDALPAYGPHGCAIRMGGVVRRQFAQADLPFGYINAAPTIARPAFLVDELREISWLGDFDGDGIPDLVFDSISFPKQYAVVVSNHGCFRGAGALIFDSVHVERNDLPAPPSIYTSTHSGHTSFDCIEYRWNSSAITFNSVQSTECTYALDGARQQWSELCDRCEQR